MHPLTLRRVERNPVAVLTQSDPTSLNRCSSLLPHSLMLVVFPEARSDSCGSSDSSPLASGQSAP
jgi:hypothetical protein